jgi:acetyl-CoA C-acetyltransferase
MRKVAVVASAQSGYERKNRTESTPELIYRVTKQVLQEAGLTRDDIDTVVVGSCDMMDGISISNVYSVAPTAAFLKDETKVEEDAAFAALYAWIRILSGAFDTALVVGWGKGSETSMPLYTGLIFDPLYQRPLGLEAVSAFALQARAYMERYKISEEDAARVVVKNRENAQRNPYAQTRDACTTDDVLDSEPLATPIKKMDAPPISDGACALILAAEDRAREICDTPAWIWGAGSAADAYHLGYRDLAGLGACKQAARKAYEMAGIKNPRKDIDTAEVMEVFSFQEMMLYEALGFCEPGQGANLVREGVTGMKGDLPVNPSGGSLCANPTPATGLVRMAEAALQVSGKAGERQVADAGTALVHATSGLCMQSDVVFVLGRE